VAPSPSSPLTILAPLAIEARAARSGAPWAAVHRIGMGARRATFGAAMSAGEGPDPVLLAGFCGGLDDGLRPGDVVLPSEMQAPGGTTRCADPTILASVLRRGGLRVRVGPLASSARVVTRGRRHQMARAGALAVDMESAPVLRTLAERPVFVLRVVIDTSSHELHRPLRTAKAFATAYRSLRQACSSLEEWASALGAREVVLGTPRASCAGVERAVEVVERVLEAAGPPVYVRKQIVHNAHVIADLERRGAVFVEEIDEVPAGATVIFSAHGVSPEVRRRAGERSLEVIDATCPLVAKVHAEARRFKDRDYDIVLVGHEGHEEVEGTLGEAPERTQVVASVEELDGLEVKDPARVAYLTQTTLALDDTAAVVDALKTRFPALVGPRSSDICYATQNRQDAVRSLASECDLVLVIGSSNSSNSQRLVEVAERAGCRALLIEDGSQIPLRLLAGARRIGVTAGASAPEALVSDLISALAGLGEISVSERRVATEDVRFKLPAGLPGKD
jgi:4-hydroxy-3-methylbut-2-enyl diphosphate reductase